MRTYEGRRAARALALTAGLVSLLCLPAVANAAAPTWLEGQRIEPNQGTISGLSCATPTMCAAASTVPIIQDNGPSFEPASDPDPLSELNAVSCARNTDFCMFVDNNGGALTYNNGNFGQLTPVADTTVELQDASCPTATFCMAIGNNNVVYKYASGLWNGGTTLTTPLGTSFTNFFNVSCADPSFCVAVASSNDGTHDGQLYYKWNGSTWSGPLGPFDIDVNHIMSLSCTSTSFCMATDESGNASVFDGTSTWTTTTGVDTFNASPQLRSSCVGTTCVGVDYYENFTETTDGGLHWSTPVSIQSPTGLSAIYSVTCATATLCVAGDGLGGESTYTIPPALGQPHLTGTPTIGNTLTLTHTTTALPNVWYTDNWRRCDNPAATCTIDPISTSTQSYKLVAADVGKYIDTLETVGFGFDEEQDIASNVIGPIKGNTPPPPKPGTATFAGDHTKNGVATISLHCSGGPCRGKVKLIYKHKTIGGPVSYSIAAGQTGKVRIKLTTAGRKALKRHHGHLKVTLVIAPSSGRSVSVTITLKR
jgi:hypothetical protein